MPNQRIKYLISFLVLLLIEIFIALFVRDSFIRPYVGDILVVPVVYCFLGTIFIHRLKELPHYTFLIAVLVELLQLANFLEYFPILNNRFFNILLGSVFDLKDILCYFIGYILIILAELSLKKFPNPK